MRAVQVGVLSAIAGLFAAAWGCLPDLLVTVTEPPPACGDGIIQPDAGEQCDPGDAGDAASLACTGTCKVSCTLGALPLVDPATNHCYFPLPGPTGTGFSHDVNVASASCEAQGAHLVRFVSESEVALVAGWVPAAPFWVGLTEATTSSWLPVVPPAASEPGWSPSCPGCFAHVAAGDGGIPAGADLSDVGSCVVGYAGSDASSPSWTQSLCHTAKDGGGLLSRQTICEREPLGTRTTACGANACFTVAATQDRKRYVLLGSPVVAADAVRGCSGAGAGGRLVVFESREEREQVGQELGAQRVVPPTPMGFWMGLSLQASGAWGWEAPDAGGLEPLPWANLQPAPVDSGAGRAFFVVGSALVNSELARAGDATDGGTPRYAVCEL